MKKIAISLICPLIGVLLLTSCLGDDEETVLSSDVALLSFSIGDLKTEHTIKKENGEDSTYITVMSGKTVEFTIDQDQRTVYNSDSIAYGTNVTKVLVNLKADGGVCYLKADGAIGSIEDSIDFTHPVTFRVTSYDEQFVRDYKVSINVHQVDPKKTSWIQMAKTNFPADLFAEQKAFVKGDSLIVIGKDDEGVYHTATTTLADGKVWNTTECEGIQGSGTGLSALLAGEAFLLTTDAALYRSYDAIVWEEVTTTSTPLELLAVEEGDLPVVWAADATGLVSSVDMVTWQNQQPKQAIGAGVASFCQPLRTNANILRTIFVATSAVESDAYAQVWTKLSTEEGWVEIEPQGTNVYGCPNLKNLVVVQYAGNMYAFGSKSKVCYESRDNGVTWKENEKTFNLPEAFEKRTSTFSATTDGEYVWVMWSDGEVWRGRWNGL